MSKLAKQENARKEEAKKEQQRLDAAQKKIEQENEVNIAINESTEWCSGRLVVLIILMGTGTVTFIGCNMRESDSYFC